MSAFADGPGEGCEGLANDSELSRSWMRSSAPAGARACKSAIETMPWPVSTAKPQDIFRNAWNLGSSAAICNDQRSRAVRLPAHRLIQLRLSSPCSAQASATFPREGGKGESFWGSRHHHIRYPYVPMGFGRLRIPRNIAVASGDGNVTSRESCGRGGNQ